MGKLATAERVSRDASDNFVFQRSLLAYDRAAEIVSGDVLEIGTGTGYGIELVAPHCDRFVTVDKYAAGGDRHAANVEFRRMCVPPLGFGDESFDFVITFQVIERTGEKVAEIALGVPGEHNVRNALAALAVARELSLDLAAAASALARFAGTGRRFDLRGEANGVVLIDDYAHLPTEIRATLAAAR